MKEDEENYYNEEQQMIEQEDLVEQAAKHVMMAKKQRELFNIKKDLATVDAISHPPTPDEHKVLCFVADYAQNMDIPSFRSEQPGETYYYSPLNDYCFGIVDCSHDPCLLTAYNYTEDYAKKGGNNVASMLWIHLCSKKLLPNPTTDFAHKPIKEINLVFDNCSGQNKNRMVLRLLFFMVKLKMCCTARAIFLVRGHTKNDCDRMFNQMKKLYWRQNIYTPNDLIQALNKGKQVDAVLLEEDGHMKDWDALEDKLMKRLVGVKKNHIFEVTVNDSNAIKMYEYDGAPPTRHVVVRPEYHEVEDWYPFLDELSTIQTLGMPDIKWKELHDKWGPLIPESKKKEYRYYHEDLPADLRAQISTNTKKAQATRKERSRGSSATLNNRHSDGHQQQQEIFDIKTAEERMVI